MENTQAVAVTRKLGSDQLGWYIFDAVFSEGHQSDLEITDNPVETGVVLSDHAYMKPLTLSLSAGVSDTPLYSLTAGKDPFASETGRAKRAFELLTGLQKRAEPFDVQTGLKLYKNMICTSIRTSQDKDNANALMFEASLREVLIVSTQTVKYQVKPKTGAANRQASKKKNAGEQQAKEETKPKTKSGVKDCLNNGRKRKS